MKNLKKETRKKMIKMRGSLSKEYRVEGSKDILNSLVTDKRVEDADTIFVFLSFGIEVDTLPLVEQLLGAGKSVCIPLIVDKNMKAIGIDNLHQLQKNKMGILEPLGDEREVHREEIDLIVVPGVAFDSRGYRIGYGGGYYDKFMEDMKRSVPKIAISYDIQIIEKVNKDPWDIRVDSLVTEKRTLHFSRIREFGVEVGNLPTGPLNKITDVEGVLVGHSTIDTPDNKTGVTIILPHGRNPYTDKVVAASYVLNGFGKTSGLIQIDELGLLESPIALTNTLNVGLVQDALVGYMVDHAKKEGRELLSLNTVVGECNDSYLNNIGERAVGEVDVLKAIEGVAVDFPEGDLGAGKGVSCYSLKGGIGSSSRVINIGDKEYTIGVLVQSNFGIIDDLTIDGIKIGKKISPLITDKGKVDKGSVMIIVATDIPLTSRQLKRVCKRASIGLARTGSSMGHGSGEIVIGFSTGNIITENRSDIDTIQCIKEEHIDSLFRGTGEAVEEAVLNSMITSSEVTGYKGHQRKTLVDFIHLLKIQEGL